MKAIETKLCWLQVVTNQQIDPFVLLPSGRSIQLTQKCQFPFFHHPALAVIVIRIGKLCREYEDNTKSKVPLARANCFQQTEKHLLRTL